MRPDYCPVANEPCQAMCLDRCRLRKTPQRCEWVGLTDEEAMQIIDVARHGSTSSFGFMRAARAIEAALKARNA